MEINKSEVINVLQITATENELNRLSNSFNEIFTILSKNNLIMDERFSEFVSFKNQLVKARLETV